MANAHAHDIDAVRRALAERWVLQDHGSYGQVTDLDGNHIAVIGYEPLQVEIELSVVFLEDADDLDALAAEADAMLRREHGETWALQGFQAAPQGEVREGELVDDPDRSLWSYDLPLTTRADSPEHIARILSWVEQQNMDFVI